MWKHMGTTLLYAIKVYRIVDFCGAVLTGALPKLREELATALNAIFVPISVSYFRTCSGRFTQS